MAVDTTFILAAYYMADIGYMDDSFAALKFHLIKYSQHIVLDSWIILVVL